MLAGLFRKNLFQAKVLGQERVHSFAYAHMKPTQLFEGKIAVSVHEAALALGISKISLRRLIYKGLIRTYKIGRRRLLSVEELQRFLRKTME